jgi:uncharacterized glyoxalase superfamily protein PhnB
MMKPTPKGWPRISSCLSYRNAGEMIDWLCQAYGFEIRLKVEGDAGRIEHSELTYGDDGLIMVGSEKEGYGGASSVPLRSPANVNGANTQSLMVYVDNVDAHCAHARAAGAKIVNELADHDYGEDYWTDRGYGALDPEGHVWWFTQRMRDPK